MKIHYYFLPLCLAAGCFSACSSDDEMTMLQADATTENVQFETMASFPEKDKSSKLNTNSIRAVYTLLDKIGPEIDTGMPNFEITEAQYEEIKEFTDKLVEGLEKDADIYDKIFTWIVNNVKYNWADNNPIPCSRISRAYVRVMPTSSTRCSTRRASPLSTSTVCSSPTVVMPGTMCTTTTAGG